MTGEELVVTGIGVEDAVATGVCSGVATSGEGDEFNGTQAARLTENTNNKLTNIFFNLNTLDHMLAD